jgi:hypothetical protein
MATPPQEEPEVLTSVKVAGLSSVVFRIVISPIPYERLPIRMFSLASC